MIYFFLKGFLVGFIIAAPVGPSAVLCVEKTITDGFIHGIMISLGIATADIVYSSIVVFSISKIANFLIQYNLYFKLSSIILLISIAIKTLLRNRIINNDNTIIHYKESLFKKYIYGIVLTIGNPMTIFGLFTLFSIFNIICNTKFDSISTLIGIFCGSSFLQIMLCILTYSLKHKINTKKVSMIASVIILLFAIYLIFSLII